VGSIPPKVVETAKDLPVTAREYLSNTGYTKETAIKMLTSFRGMCPKGDDPGFTSCTISSGENIATLDASTAQKIDAILKELKGTTKRPYKVKKGM
jgi:hypothetical protein